MMSRAAGLQADPEDCEGLLLKKPVYFVRPDARVNAHLSFAPTRRIAPLEIMRWMTHGSILAWVEQLSTRAGTMDGLRAENFMAREIMLTGVTLATMLDEFHPSTVVFSATVERLVRRLVVLEESMSVEKDQMSKFYAKKLAFLGIGGGALPATRELFQA